MSATTASQSDKCPISLFCKITLKRIVAVLSNFGYVPYPNPNPSARESAHEIKIVVKLISNSSSPSSSSADVVDAGVISYETAAGAKANAGVAPFMQPAAPDGSAVAIDELAGEESAATPASFDTTGAAVLKAGLVVSRFFVAKADEA